MGDHSRLTPTGGESEAAKRHRTSIEACLKKNFEITRFFRTGSFGNGTSIRGYSDVDYFASIPTKNLKQNSDTTLRVVRDALDARFPNTGVTVRTPAVLVPFGTDASESTEVVPADFITKDKNGYHIYEIADGDGAWMKSSPDAHNAYVANINDKLGKKGQTPREVLESMEILSERTNIFILLGITSCKICVWREFHRIFIRCQESSQDAVG